MSNKDCGHKVPCGCGDGALKSAPPCSEANCAGENCAEVFCQECIANCQPEIEYVIGESTFVIPAGARLDSILQKLLVFMNDPLCAEVTALGLKTTSIGTDSITIAWDESSIPGISYTINWETGGNTVQENVQDITSYTINNLAPDTEYSIYIETNNAPCVSVTLKIKTKPA
jgi:hypothetical protein